MSNSGERTTNMALLLVINLERSPHRRHFMHSLLKRIGLPYEILTAIDSDHPAVRQAPSNDRGIPSTTPMSLAERACALSHAAALRQFSRQTAHPFGLILEDDVLVASALPRILPALEEVQSDNDLTLLYAMVYAPVDLRNESHLIDRYAIYTPHPLSKVWGAQAYFVSRSLAGRLAAFLEEGVFRSDDWDLFVHLNVKVRVRVVFPFPALHAEFDSDRSPSGGSLTNTIRGRIQNLFSGPGRRFLNNPLRLAGRRATAEARQRQFLTKEGSPVTRTYYL